MSSRAWMILGVALLCSIVTGCTGGGQAEPFGKTFYVGGASNLDLFGNGVPEGLRAAGYRGDVRNFVWTISFNPLVDQLVTVNAKARAGLLSQNMERYHQRYPQNEINVIALSAGTGVAIWAIEDLKRARANNVILLGSSLSHDYDVSQALRHIKGKIYVYYSSYDAVLEAVEIVGTIDGKRGAKSAGQVGLKAPRGAEDRIVNVPWQRSYMRYGWAGGHTDCVNDRFIRYVVGPLIVPDAAPDPTMAPTRPVRTAAYRRSAATP